MDVMGCQWRNDPCLHVTSQLLLEGMTDSYKFIDRKVSSDKSDSRGRSVKARKWTTA